MIVKVSSQFRGNTYLGAMGFARKYGSPPHGPMNQPLVAIAELLLPADHHAVIEVIAPVVVENQQPTSVVMARLNQETGLMLMSLEPGTHTFSPPSQGVGYLILVSERPRPLQPIPLTSIDLDVTESPLIAPLRVDASICVDAAPNLRIIWNTNYQPQHGKIESISRVGTRVVVEGAPMIASPRRSLPTVPGAIQLSPSGELLIHGPDGPVTGGYPIIGGVTSDDLPRISLWSPGQQISMSAVDRSEALIAVRTKSAAVQKLNQQVMIARRIHLGDTR